MFRNALTGAKTEMSEDNLLDDCISIFFDLHVAYHVHIMCISCAYHVHIMCISCAYHVHIMCSRCHRSLDALSHSKDARTFAEASGPGPPGPGSAPASGSSIRGRVA